jgi:signal transduction histidine kinase
MYVVDWLVPQPLLGKAVTLAAELSAPESSWEDLSASWWVVPLLVGWSGLTGWQELRRRRALREADAYKAQLAQVQAENAELRQKLVHREECIVHLSHELRNPLNQVIGEAELVLEHNGRSRMELRPVLRALRRLAWRIDSIERHYQLTDDQWTSFPETVTIEPWLRGQVESLDLGELSVRVDFSVAIDNPDHIHLAELNTADLRTVLRHLVHNAIRFTVEGKIEVKFHLSLQEPVSYTHLRAHET